MQSEEAYLNQNLPTDSPEEAFSFSFSFGTSLVRDLDQQLVGANKNCIACDRRRAFDGDA